MLTGVGVTGWPTLQPRNTQITPFPPSKSTDFIDEFGVSWLDPTLAPVSGDVM